MSRLQSKGGEIGIPITRGWGEIDTPFYKPYPHAHSLIIDSMIRLKICTTNIIV